MKNINFNNKKVAVLGMGIEGLALIDFLFGKDCIISALDKLSAEEIDKRLTEEEKKLFKRIIEDEKVIKIFGDNYLNNLTEYDVIFRSPGISYHNPKIQEAKNKGVEISSQIKLFFDLCPCQIIGVTGTKGKGTTSSLIYEIMKKNNQETRNNNQTNQKFQNPNDKLQIKNQNPNNKLQTSLNPKPSALNPSVYLAGNIGTPAISLISELKSDDIVILELSSFQLMDLEKSPHIAVVTNLFVDHLDYHQDIREYQAAKENIVKFQEKNDFVILNSNSTFDQFFVSAIKSTKKYFSNSNVGNAVIIEDSVILDPENRNINICDKDNIQLFGHHNLENIAAATLVADLLEIDTDTIKEVIKEFKGLPHRLEFVAEIDGIKFIDDSFATNPGPTIAAIDSFTEKKVMILGGSSKGADFSELAQKIVDSKILGVVLIGDESDKIEKSLFEASYSGQTEKGLSNMDEIVKAGKELASSGDIVILSPACASFGLFKNYKDRGEQFKNEVFKLKSEIPASPAGRRNPNS